MSKILSAIVLLVVFSLLILLGFWQLNRADEKQQILKYIEKKNQQAPILIDGNYENLIDNIYQIIKLRGKYDDKHQFIYDNQTHEQQAGYYVLTPFYLQNTTYVLLVNRGFVSWGNDRSKLANIDIESNKREIIVEILKPIVRIQLTEDDAVFKYPRLIQTLDIKKIIKASNINLLPVVARLIKSEPDGFIRAWQPFYGSVDKHIAYAWQWFLMSVVLGIISIYLYFKSR